MSLRAIPLIAVAFILYNVVVLLGGDSPPGEILATQLFEIPMLHAEARWAFTWGDFLILLVLMLLFVELLKATYTSTASLLDHGLSMIVFVVCLIEFLLVRQAASSVFFFITMAALIDVVAGYTIGIRVARRDFQIGE
ncbi:MAG: hypothetical protein KJZ80_04000 [Hyphomicrobiaceae bacterium]|nr:hypothetical protein [Hyphomicrobiaceae bacterium]